MFIKVKIFLFLVLSAHWVFGQESITHNSSIGELIKKQLTPSDFRKLELLEKEERAGMKLLSEVDKKYEEISILNQEIDSNKDKKYRERLLKKSKKIEKKAVRNHVESLKILSEAFVKKYEIFRNDIKKFHTLPDDKINIVEDLKKQAFESFEKADLNVQKVFYTVNPTELFKLFTEAFKHEQLGLLYLEKIYAVILNWQSIPSNSNEEKIEAILLNKPVKIEQTMYLGDIKDSVKISTVLVYDTIQVEKLIETQIVYKIQIAASKTQLSIEKLKAIYNEENLIQYDIVDGWFKYSVGYFSSYQDAQNFKTRIGVPGAFIIAFKNGKRVPIKELTNHSSYLGKN